MEISELLLLDEDIAKEPECCQPYLRTIAFIHEAIVDTAFTGVAEAGEEAEAFVLAYFNEHLDCTFHANSYPLRSSHR